MTYIRKPQKVEAFNYNEINDIFTHKSVIVEEYKKEEFEEIKIFGISIKKCSDTEFYVKCDTIPVNSIISPSNNKVLIIYGYGQSEIIHKNMLESHYDKMGR